MMEAAIIHIYSGSSLHQFMEFVEGGIRCKRDVGGGRNHDCHIYTTFNRTLERFVDGGSRYEIRIDDVHVLLCRIDGHRISMTEHAAVFLRCTVDNGDYYLGAVRLSLVEGEVGFATDVLFSLFVPYGEKYFLQIIDSIPFDSHVHITPCTDFGESVDVIVGDVHSSRIGDFTVDNGYFPVVAVGRMVDIWEGERIEFDNLDSLFAYFLEMLFLSGLLFDQLPNASNMARTSTPSFTFSASRANNALAIESLRKLKYSRWI